MIEKANEFLQNNDIMVRIGPTWYSLEELGKISVNSLSIIVSDEDSLFLINNKCLLYQHLKNNNVDVPKYFIANNKDQLKESVIKLNYEKVPVVIKPCIGNGSRGVRVLDGNADRYDMLFNQKPNSIFSTLEEVITSIGDKKIPPIVVSEYLPGTELTIDTIVDNGTLLDCLIRTRNCRKSLKQPVGDKNELPGGSG